MQIKNSQDIGVNLKKYRKESGLTQQELADLAGVSRKVLSELESGKETIQLNMILKILSVTNLQLNLTGISS